MKRTVRYIKDANLNIRVDRVALNRWKAKAKQTKQTLTKFVVETLNRQVSA